MLTAAQLKMRKTGFGGSDVAAALGLSPWKTQLQLWAEKASNLPPVEQNDAMEWGSRLEYAIIEKFGDEHPEMNVAHAGVTNRHGEYPFLLATPDASIVDKEEGAGIFEAKTSRGVPWDDVPDHYLFQVQHYMYVMSAKFAYVGALFNGREYREYGPFYASTEWYEGTVIPQLKQMWDAIEAKDPSDFPPVNLADMAILSPVDKEVKPITATEDMIDDYKRCKMYNSQIATAKAGLKEAQLSLAQAMGDCPKLIDDETGKTLAVQIQTADSIVVDSKKLKTLAPDLFEKYSKPKKGYRSLRVY